MNQSPSDFSVRHALLAFLAAVTIVPSIAQETETPLNESVVLELAHRCHMAAEVIVEMIGGSQTAFDRAMLELQKAAVPAEVLKEMAAARESALAPPRSPSPEQGSRGQPPSSLASNPASNFVGTRCSDPGVFVDYGDSLSILEPEPLRRGRLVGLWSRKIEYIRGVKALVRVETSQPKLLFCLENDTTPVPFLTTTMHTYLLLQMQINKKDNRRYADIFRPSKLFRWEGRDLVMHDFRHTRLDPGVYEVEPIGELRPGEYAFLFLDPGGHKFYPFGID